MSTTPLLGGISPGATSTVSVRPVEIEVRRDHAYKNRGKGKNGCGARLPNGETCMKAITHVDHLGLPLSLNVALAKHIRSYRSLKEAWDEQLTERLIASGLPAGWAENAPAGTPKIELIAVEALLCFPVVRFARDQGNFRWFLEKCLGDALDRGGWIENDSIYPDRHYDFGGLEIQYRPREAWTRMILFPTTS